MSLPDDPELDPEVLATQTSVAEPVATSHKLTPITQDFVVHWGEMGARWGVNRTVAQIHALLFISARPMHAEEMVECLAVARSNVSNSLRELQGWGLIRIVHLLGDRRDHFEAQGDVWALFKTVLAQRKEREFDPTVGAISRCIDHPDFKAEPLAAQMRLREMHELMASMSGWAEQMLKLSPATLTKGMRLGAKIQQFLR
jgi:DNA-binding transcriptional regulator GbsR (MarR family)